MPQRRGWGIDRSVNPIYIAALITVVISLLIWAGGPNGINAHFSSIDTTLLNHTETDKGTEKRVESLERKMDERLKSIDDKLDRLIERVRR